MAEANSGAVDYNTFEDFLDSQVAPIDLYYLEVLIRFLV
jgi:hypothetical protein